MRTTLKIVTVFFALGAGLTAAATLHARDAENSKSSPMSHGMMEQGGMGGMMSMMSRLGDMMKGCTRMMHDSTSKPNEQWRDTTPAKPESKS